MRNIQWGVGIENRKDIGFNVEWVLNKEVTFAFRVERQECITNVRTWGSAFQGE